MTQNTSTKPIHTIRYGNVRAAIWQNENGFYSLTAERSYKTGDSWNRSDSFGRDDLPKLQAALADGYRWIFQQGQNDGAGNE